MVVACLVLAAGCGGTARTPSANPAPSFGTVLDGPVPASLLSLRLVDSQGRPRTLDALRGKVLVISDGMTLCQESCPLGTATLVRAARALNRSALAGKVEFLLITIDPARDDLHHLAAYQAQFGTPPNWATLTGSAADINRLWTRLGVWRHHVRVDRPYPRDWLTGAALTTDIQHTDDVIIVDGRQRFRFELEGIGSVPSAKAIPSRIYRFMDALGHRNVTNPSPGGWSAEQVVTAVRWVLHAQGDPA